MSWFEQLSTQNRLMLIFSVMVVITAMLVAGSITTVIILKQQVDQMAQEADNLAQTAAAQANFLKQQIALRDYLISGQVVYAAYNTRYAQDLSDYQNYAGARTEIFYDNADLVNLNAARNTYNKASEALLAAYEAGQEFQPLLYPGLQDANAQVQNQLTDIQTKQQIKLGALVNRSGAYAQGYVIAGLISLLFVLLIGIAATRVAFEVSEPIQYMTNAIVAFENHTFNPNLLMRYKRRQDDLGLLARSFNQMAASIEETARERNNFIQSASRFVPTQYLEFLGKDNINQIRLGDHVAAEMAVMFSDVRGFTTMSEGMTPKQNFDFVNEYLRLVSPIIQKHNGFIVKFLGDGMMAVFPYGVDDAVQAGIEKQQHVKNFNAELAKRGLPPIKVGIGIHTGHMMVGMIGEEYRLQGDAFSDNVNLTSRVEGLTKYYGVSMIITEETRMRLERPIPYRMRYMGKAQVKGRETPIGLYDVYDGEPDHEAAAKATTQAVYEQGLREYNAGRLEAAQQAFESVLVQNPNDKTAAFFLARAREWQTKTLSQGWEGVEVMDAK